MTLLERMLSNPLLQNIPPEQKALVEIILQVVATEMDEQWDRQY